MPDQANNFFWYELMTTDPAAALKFYQAVVGWGAHQADAPNDKYTLLTVNDKGIAGLMELPQDVCEAGGKPGWVGYIQVNDTDAYVAKVVEKGGKTYCPPMDIPMVGRFAVVADPHGAVFNLMAPSGDGEMQWPDPKSPGMIGWRELHAGNGEEAWEFYSSLFGWTKAYAMDMGPMGVYQSFNVGDEWTGGMMTKMEDCPMPFWTYYFNVDDINAATERVKENGGQILMGPHEVPGGNWIVQCFDPQGAMFCLMQLPKEA